MNQNSLFQIEGLRLNSNDRQDVLILPQTFGLKLLNPIDLSIINYLHYNDETIIFDWKESLENEIAENPYFLLIYQRHQFKIYGTSQQVRNLKEFCQGKFIFRRNDIYLQEGIIDSGTTFQICQVTNKLNGKKYIEKKINQSLYSEELSNSVITEFGQEKVPEEIRVLQALNMYRCPYLMKLESITYDGECYSYLYPVRPLISLKQIFKKYRNPPISFIIEVSEQLLQVLLVFQELQIIHNGINMDNIFYSQETNSIVISDFSYSVFETQQRSIFKGNSVGLIPPEYFVPHVLITTQANIYQLGILIYCMYVYYVKQIRLFSENPFGKDQPQIVRNNIKGEFQIKNTKVDKNIIDLLKSMMQKNPLKRKLPKEYLFSKIFTPCYKQRVSRTSFLSFLQKNFSPQDNYEVEDEDTSIQSLKLLQTHKMKKQ